MVANFNSLCYNKGKERKRELYMYEFIADLDAYFC